MRDGNYQIAFSHRNGLDLSKLILVEVSIAQQAALGETSEAVRVYSSPAQKVEPFDHLDLRYFVVAIDINPALNTP
jgi:hypothetical protein